MEAAFFERFVLQRKQKDGTYADWRNTVNGQLEYESHGAAAAELLRRANAIDFRIVRRIYTWFDTPVRAYL
jgi:hypothetical protein